MREIKFRVWDKELKQMLHTTDLEWHDDSFGFRLEEHTEDIEHNLMQYTGLKDKNGTEIYEGDIVQCNGNKDDLHEIKFGEFKVYGHDSEEAIDIAEGWYFKILDNDVFSNVEPFCYPTPLNKYWVDKIDVKVIGNIYENPELIA